MSIEKTLLRLGGIAVAAAVVAAAAPAVVAHADTTPSPAVTAGGSASTSATPTATASSPSATTSTTTSTPAAAETPSTAPSAVSTDGTAVRQVPAAASATASATKAAAWLVTQLTDGDHVTDTYAGKVYPDYGDTADIAFSLASTGTQDATLVKVVRYLEANVVGYADPKGAEGGPFSGSLGKLALVAEATGQDPHDFGGYDLLALITSHVCTAAIAGVDSPCSAAGDFENAYVPTSQALDVLALERGGVTVPPTALARLISLQCTDGGFSGAFTTATVPCASDVDTTGYAEQALVLDTAATAQVSAASQYLLGSQLADGGWYGTSSASATDANANSTALALEALLAGPPATLAPKTATGPRVVSATAVAAGQTLLASLQHADGALQISPAAKSPTDDVLATDQSVPAIAGADLTTLVHRVSLATTSPTPSTTGTSGTAAAPTPAPTTPVATISDGPTAGGSLPFTGTDASLWSELAALLLVVGTGLLVGGHTLRRRGAHR